MTERVLKGLRSALNWNRANGRNGVVIRLKELEELVDIAERERWVKTEDGLPGRDCYCLCYDGRLVRILFFSFASETFSNCPDSEVIETRHIRCWRPLPPQPQEEEL